MYNQKNEAGRNKCDYRGEIRAKTEEKENVECDETTSYLLNLQRSYSHYYVYWKKSHNRKKASMNDSSRHSPIFSSS